MAIIKQKHYNLLVIILPFLFLYFHPIKSHEHVWGYTDSDGPSTWGGICDTGRRQSPIDIQKSNVDVVKVPKLNFFNYENFGPVDVNDINENGITLTISGFHNWGPKWPYISGGGLKHNYQLIQFHIHWSQMDGNGSEHAINGKFYPAEIHLLHLKQGNSLNQSFYESDGIAVVSIMMQMGLNSAALAPLDIPFRAMLRPKNKGKDTKGYAFQPKTVLPLSTESFYQYQGSLTTPGCEEAVIWTILTDPSIITQSQLSLLRKIRKTVGNPLKNNDRPIQPLNGRRIKFQPRSFYHMCKSNDPALKLYNQRKCPPP